jgi:hypothetical protein
MPDSDWAVYRLDFAGNHFLVAKHLTEAGARELVAEFEAHKHHQHYWAERAPHQPRDFAEVLRASLRTGSSLDASLKVLKNQNASVAECIEAVQQVRGTSIIEAQELVRHSSAFAVETE